MKLYLYSDQDAMYGFMCPGCNRSHSIPTEGGNAWCWNKSMDKPTFAPSIFVNRGKTNPSVPQCHSYVTDGRIQFLNDCSHTLAGQTVELPEIDKHGAKL
jgi:hypothetical protein